LQAHGLAAFVQTSQQELLEALQRLKRQKVPRGIALVHPQNLPGMVALSLR
jgi:hypothetical protein